MDGSIRRRSASSAVDQTREASEPRGSSCALRRFASLEEQMTKLKYLYGLFSQRGERSGEGVSPGNYYKSPSSEIIDDTFAYICMFKGPVCKIC